MNKVLFALCLLAFANATFRTFEANKQNTAKVFKPSTTVVEVKAKGEHELKDDKKDKLEDDKEEEDGKKHQLKDDRKDKLEDDKEEEEDGKKHKLKDDKKDKLEDDKEEEEEEEDEKNKLACKWDEVAIQCNSNCYPWMIGDKTCDAACNVPRCKHDKGDCKHKHKGVDKPKHDSKYCYFDKHSPKKSCLLKDVGNKKCNWECFRAECNFDKGDCLHTDWDNKKLKKTNCAPGCTYKMIGNKTCDWACFTKSCKFDLKDCCHKTSIKNVISR